VRVSPPLCSRKGLFGFQHFSPSLCIRKKISTIFFKIKLYVGEVESAVTTDFWIEKGEMRSIDREPLRLFSINEDPKRDKAYIYIGPRVTRI
jgi:hypothetical protein